MTRARAQQFGKAIALLQQSIALDPEDAEAHATLGMLFLHIGQPRRALPSFERMRELTPGDPRVHAALGTTYRQLGRYDEAKPELSEALRHFPSDLPLLLQLGQVARSTNDYALCSKSFREFVAILDRRGLAHLPETYKEDYQKALSFAEMCEARLH